MPTETPRILLRLRYYEAAQAYLRSLPLEHFMEATPQATQREITLESLALVRARRPDVHVFNELLVQYPLPRRKNPGQVVPDNMVVVHPEPIQAEGSYDVPLQPVGPFWVLEYVSRSNKRKDYDENMTKYEHELKVPYYMLFTPHEQEVTLYRYKGKRYVSVPPNEQGRLPLPELELEMALLDGWVRYWYRGELLPLPGDLLSRVEELGRELNEAHRQRDEAQQQRDAEQERRIAAEAETARLRAELEALRRRTAEK
ncbi:MAG TPA: Uma2 family endonuclease [Gemmataceae bacterium]|nr:Uma2 family endonuclease [Gemmataceae bacterium]